MASTVMLRILVLAVVVVDVVVVAAVASSHSCPDELLQLHKVQLLQLQNVQKKVGSARENGSPGKKM